MEVIDKLVLVVVVREYDVFSVRVISNFGIDDLKRKICGFWVDLSPSIFNLSYNQGLKHSIIESDYDLQSLICFNFDKGIRSVTLNLCLKLIVGSVGSVDIGSSSCTSMVDDVSAYLTTANIIVLSGVGQRFQGGASEFRLQLLRHCILNEFKVKLLKNEPCRVTAECVMREERGCLWRVHASTKRNLPKFFEIKTMNGIHTCGAGLKDVENPPMSSKLVKSVVVDMLRDRSLLKSKKIIDYFRREFGVSLSYYFAYQGKELASKEIYGCEEMSYNHLQSYIEQLKLSNHGSHVVLEKDVEPKKFRRLFVSFLAISMGFSFCRPVIIFGLNIFERQKERMFVRSKCKK